MNKNNKQLYLNPLHGQWVYEFGEAIKLNSWFPLDTRLIDPDYHPGNPFKERMDLWFKKNPEPKKFITAEELLEVSRTKEDVLKSQKELSKKMKNNSNNFSRFRPASFAVPAPKNGY